MLENLRQAVAEAEADNSDFQYGVAKFRDLYHLSISPAVSEVDVRKMLLQHILTQDILVRVLGQVQFRNENNVAGQLSALEKTFFTGDVRRQAIDRLRSDYRAIGRAADEVADYPQEAEVPAGDLRGLLQGLQPRRCRLPERGITISRRPQEMASS